MTADCCGLPCPSCYSASKDAEGGGGWPDGPAAEPGVHQRDSQAPGGAPRPWLTVEGLAPLIAEHDPNSFPSGHTSASFAAASAWCRTLPRRWMGVTAVVLAAMMGFSRLYVGSTSPVMCWPGCWWACSAAGWPACSGNALPLGRDWRRNTKKELYPRRDTALFGKRVKKLTSARPWHRPLPASSSAPRPRPWRRPP